MIKLKKLIKEEVDRKQLKDALGDTMDAANALSKSLSEFVNIFARAYKSDIGGMMNDPLFKFIMKNINAKGKINKLGAWKKHFAKLEKKL